MELQARVTALEEEVGVLKGEIKAILQEVRIAVLARQNPFLDSSDVPATTPVVNVLTELPAAKAADPAPATAPPPPTPLRPVTRSDDPVEELWMPEPDSAPAVHPTPANSSPRPLDLAALLTWVQDASERFSEADFAIMLSIGAYGGMIDEDLKDTLLELAANLPSDETHRATLPEFTLALQQLEALRDNAPARKPASRRHVA